MCSVSHINFSKNNFKLKQKEENMPRGRKKKIVDDQIQLSDIIVNSYNDIQNDSDVLDDIPKEIVVNDTPQPKKRGRKPKIKLVDELCSLNNNVEETNSISDVCSVNVALTPKKKRGRPPRIKQDLPQTNVDYDNAPKREEIKLIVEKPRINLNEIIETTVVKSAPMSEVFKDELKQSGEEVVQQVIEKTETEDLVMRAKKQKLAELKEKILQMTPEEREQRLEELKRQRGRKKTPEEEFKYDTFSFVSAIRSTSENIYYRNHHLSKLPSRDFEDPYEYSFLICNDSVLLFADESGRFISYSNPDIMFVPKGIPDRVDVLKDGFILTYKPDDRPGSVEKRVFVDSVRTTVFEIDPTNSLRVLRSIVIPKKANNIRVTNIDESKRHESFEAFIMETEYCLGDDIKKEFLQLHGDTQKIKNRLMDIFKDPDTNIMKKIELHERILSSFNIEKLK